MDSLWLAQCMMYLVFLFALVAYITLDGFDLGVGCLHLFAKGDEERRMMINSIGPVWDGNSTWIVIGGGILFAAFPKAFTILAPNLYTPLMMMLFGFMLRAAAIEFRGKIEGKKWKQFWDVNFCIASGLLAFLLGVVLGNLIQGIPLDDQGELVGGFISVLRPYPLLVSLLGIACFSMHGSLYLLMKSEGVFHERIRHWAHRSIAVFITLWFVVTIVTAYSLPHMIEPFFQHPILLFVPALSISAIAGVIYFIWYKKGDGWAFLCSCLSILFLMLLFLIGVFPYIVRSTIHPDHNSLAFFNSSVSEFALWILIGISLSGIPLSFFYFPYLYKVFKGKIKLDSMSY